MTRIPEAISANRRFTEAVEHVRGDATLSAEGKRQRLARLHRDHSRVMESLKREHLAEIESERRTLERRIFGPHVPAGAGPSETLLARLSYRDAVLRAAELNTHSEAERMMAIAMRTGDDGLARAVAVTALDHGWDAIANTFATEGDPNFGDSVNRLRQVGLSRAERISLSAAFSAPPPEELTGMGTGRVGSLAEGAA